MKPNRAALSFLVLAVALIGGIAWWVTRTSEAQLSRESFTARAASTSSTNTAGSDVLPATTSATGRDLEKRLAALEASVEALHRGSAGANHQLRALEASVKSLQEAMTGVSLEKASADRRALFASDEGYLKADEYAAAGQHALAAEGYLAFLQSHPNHPDARDIMKKARDSFLKAGYKEKGFWVHEEMMKSFPQHQSADLWEQAQLEKNAGFYDLAVNHAAQAAELAPSPEDRLWRRLYWAWYVQLRDGSAAGIAALEQVQQEIAASGVTNPKLTENATRRMQEWQQQARAR